MGLEPQNFQVNTPSNAAKVTPTENRVLLKLQAFRYRTFAKVRIAAPKNIAKSQEPKGTSEFVLEPKHNPHMKLNIPNSMKQSKYEYEVFVTRHT